MTATNMCSNFCGKWSSPPREIYLYMHFPVQVEVKPNPEHWPFFM